MAIPRLTIDQTVLLVVDLQEKLLSVMRQADHVIDRSGVLISGCRALGVPIVVTEQYPAGLGPTVPAIRAKLADDQRIVEKLKFSAAVADVREALESLGCTTVLVCGIEAHVCVLQSALDLAEAGYVVAVAEDAIDSRRVQDGDAALRRMAQCGVVATTAESALLEMVGEAGTTEFGAILPLIR